MVERDPRVDRKAVEMFQFVDPGQDVVFDPLGQSDIVRGQDQFHKVKMVLGSEKSQQIRRVPKRR